MKTYHQKNKLIQRTSKKLKEIKDSLDKNTTELNNIQNELKEDINNCQEELYNEYDLGLSDACLLRG